MFSGDPEDSDDTLKFREAIMDATRDKFLNTLKYYPPGTYHAFDTQSKWIMLEDGLSFEPPFEYTERAQRAVPPCILIMIETHESAAREVEAKLQRFLAARVESKVRPAVYGVSKYRSRRQVSTLSNHIPFKLPTKLLTYKPLVVVY